MQRIGLPLNTKFLRLDRVANGWRVWIAANEDYTIGTYLLLQDDGAIDRYILEPNGAEEQFSVKPADEKTLKNVLVTIAWHDKTTGYNGVYEAVVRKKDCDYIRDNNIRVYIVTEGRQTYCYFRSIPRLFNREQKTKFVSVRVDKRFYMDVVREGVQKLRQMKEERQNDE